MEQIKINDGSVWPNPVDDKYQDLAWRLRYAQNSITKYDMFQAASIMEIYSYLIIELTLDKSKKKISSIRKVINKDM